MVSDARTLVLYLRHGPQQSELVRPSIGFDGHGYAGSKIQTQLAKISNLALATQHHQM